tara:strand:+ start:6807 stop:7064 length:258 start_codon:yes stop_codon:yes gene_type:complete
MNKELSENILAIEAIKITGGFRIEAVMQSGEREVIKGKSTRKPSMVQLHSWSVNGNYRGDGLGQYFTFTPSIIYPRYWIKSFVVA